MTKEEFAKRISEILGTTVAINQVTKSFSPGSARSVFSLKLMLTQDQVTHLAKVVQEANGELIDSDVSITLRSMM